MFASTLSLAFCALVSLTAADDYTWTTVTNTHYVCPCDSTTLPGWAGWPAWSTGASMSSSYSMHPWTSSGYWTSSYSWTTSTVSSSSSTSTSSMSIGPILGSTSSSSSSTTATSTVTLSGGPIFSGTTSTTTTTSPTTSTTTTSSMSSSSTSSNSMTTSSTTTTTTTTTTSSTTTTTSAVVTNQAYINTVLRHHNAHRSNHSAPAAVWNASLADTARITAMSCNFQHDTTTNGGGYGQNIAAGYLGTQIGRPITEGFYNSEEPNYTYYGGEPDYNTLGGWGHFSQVVWKGSTSVGCYTNDCSATGLKNTGGNVPPYFTVCNYYPAGNVVGAFGANVLGPLGQPTILGNYGCPSYDNCV